MINGKDFQVENYKTESDQVEKTIGLLKEVPLLSNLTDEQLSSLVQMLQVVEYNDNDYIIRKGEQGTKFYIIKSGVAICYGGEDDVVGQKEANKESLHTLEHIQQVVFIIIYLVSTKSNTYRNS